MAEPQESRVEAAERALTAAGHGSYDATNSEAIGDSTSESHRIMTTMILTGAGMSSDLDSCDTKVELVDLVDPDTGKTIKAVVIDSTSADPQISLPQNLDEQAARVACSLGLVRPA